MGRYRGVEMLMDSDWMVLSAVVLVLCGGLAVYYIGLAVIGWFF